MLELRHWAEKISETGEIHIPAWNWLNMQTQAHKSLAIFQDGSRGCTLVTLEQSSAQGSFIQLLPVLVTVLNL